MDLGLTNYWGYQTIGFFAPDPRYLSGDDLAEVQRAIGALHGDGIEVILDVVYNHSGEGDHLGTDAVLSGPRQRQLLPAGGRPQQIRQ